MIQSFTDNLVYNIIGLDGSSPLGSTINFFVYDSLKIILILLFISFLMGLLNTFFPIEAIRNFLSSHHLYGVQYFLAAIFGAITPFCSCSSIPLFFGFVRGGIPLGVTFSFLITSPLVNEVAVAMLAGTFGLKVTVIYVGSGVFLGTFLGMFLERFKLERFLSEWVKNLQRTNESVNNDSKPCSLKQRFVQVLQKIPQVARDALGVTRSVLPYVLAGIAIGALMHGYVPSGFFEEYLSKDKWFAVPLAVILAVPMYANAAGVIPIVEVLVQKGVALGTALAFMMAVVGLSLPEAMLLKKVMTLKLIFVFFGTVTAAIIVLGIGYNLSISS